MVPMLVSRPQDAAQNQPVIHIHPVVSSPPPPTAAATGPGCLKMAMLAITLLWVVALVGNVIDAAINGEGKSFDHTMSMIVARAVMATCPCAIILVVLGITWFATSPDR
jgi:hypothetical protein